MVVVIYLERRHQRHHITLGQHRRNHQCMIIMKEEVVEEGELQERRLPTIIAIFLGLLHPIHT